jgi:release factor glutamine methyltransferase
VLDLGTGSGAIALAIAAERPYAQVVGVDVSAAALHVARRNARDLDLARVDWRLGSWFDAVGAARFDMIVSNPPYIAADDPALERLRDEPALALASGPSGLDALATITAGAARHLESGGWLIVEHGATQAAAVALLLERQGFTNIRSHVDYAGNPRISLGSVHSSL